MFKQLRTERTFEFILQQIKEAIYSGKLKVGDKLPTERELAKTFGASRASVRLAVLNLEQSGLIAIKQGAGGGFFVSNSDFKPIRDSLNDLIKSGGASIENLTEARFIIEPQSARLAAQRATPEDLQALEVCILNFQNRTADGENPHPIDLNFHVCIAQASKNPVIILLLRSLMDLLFQSIALISLTPARNLKIVQDHKRIFEAIRSRNPEKAQAAMLKHVDQMKSIFKNNNTPLTGEGIKTIN